MRSALHRFLAIPRPVLLVLSAHLLLNLVNGSLMLTFNIYLRKLGHDDSFIASITAHRFLPVLALSLPLGIFLRGRRLRGFFLAAAVLLPVATWCMLVAAQEHNETLLALATSLWGVGLMTMQVGVMPFIIRHATDETRTEAISLSFAAWSLSLLASGVAISLLGSLDTLRIGGSEWHFDEPGILRLMVFASLGSIPLLLAVNEPAVSDEKKLRLWHARKEYDWSLIARASFPNLLIAVGAGLTIPFVNLFFNEVFALDSHQFSLLGGVAGVPVMAGFLINPYVRRRFGYTTAIVLSQSLAVLFLVIMALTELARELPGMLWVAATCYLLRQPLMNMASPITSDLAINYVGKRNRELMSALGASIWSGSWFISAKVFQHLRENDFRYYQIFLITAALYLTATSCYWLLIRDYRRVAAAEISPSQPAVTDN
ncbi:MAG: MFS transporter [Planctomycetota bacterium]